MFLKENAYIDVDKIFSVCAIEKESIEEEEFDETSIGSDDEFDDGYETTNTINIFKFEIYKMLLGRVLDDFDTEDSPLSIRPNNTNSYNLAYNSLLNAGIIKHGKLEKE